MVKKYIIVQTSTDDLRLAEKIAYSALDSNKSACVNIIPSVRSIYKWKGAISKSTEYIVQIKTAKNNFKKLEKIIQELHNYETPEIISLEINKIESNFCDWLKNETE